MPYCNLCLLEKPRGEFHMRHNGTITQPYCKPCKGVWNSMRTFVDGKQVAPLIGAVRAVVQGTKQPQQPAQLKSAGHTRTKPKRKRLPMSERERRARQIVREETEKRLSKQGSRGFIYLIGETAPKNQSSLQRLFDYSPAIVPEAVKIGFADDEEERIKSLQTGNHRVLVVLATLPNKTKKDEQALHAKYIKDNVLLEWFRPTTDLLSEFGLRVAIRGLERIYLAERAA